MRGKQFDRISLIIPLLALLIYLGSRNITSTDSFWTVPTASSILHTGNIDLDEFRDLLSQQGYRDTFSRNSHRYYLFPVGTPLVTVPFVAAFDLGLGAVTTAFPRVDGFIRAHTASPMEHIDSVALAPRVELIYASLITALAAFVFYRALRHAPVSRGQAVLLTFMLAFCTPAWSTASRALWSHTPSMLLTSLVILLLLEARARPLRGFLLGAMLAFGFVVRPTNVVTAAVVAGYVFLEHRRAFGRLALGAGLVLAGFLSFNWLMYGGLLLPPYFSSGRVASPWLFPEALAGNLISPGRGLFVYCPFLVFSLYGMARGCFGRGRSNLMTVFSIIPVVQLLLVSTYPHWWGGWSFGPRFLTDVMPFLILLLIPFLKDTSAAASRRGPRTVTSVVSRVVFALLVAGSFFIHMSGAGNPESVAWNYTPSSIDAYPSRVWDWGDIPFLRGVVGLGN
jgi:hypothetical protein